MMFDESFLSGYFFLNLSEIESEEQNVFTLSLVRGLWPFQTLRRT